MKRFRVLSAYIAHETNTFCKRRTTLADYQGKQYYLGVDIARCLGGTRTEMAAHMDAAERFGWELVQPVSAQATPSGRVTAHCWEHLRDLLVSACDGAPFDGAVIALHGAMVSEADPDAEGGLLAALRERLGPDAPVAVTLDLHANVSDRMAALSNIMLAYRTYPHVDLYERGLESAELLQRAMTGEIAPRVLTRRGPLLDGCNHGRTQSGPMADMVARGLELAASAPGILAVDTCAGFPWADVEEAGPTVSVTYDTLVPGSAAMAGHCADEVFAMAWERRGEVTAAIHGIDEAMAAARSWDHSGGYLLLADFSDNPGHGAYGDNVRILRAMIGAGLPNALCAMICDPIAVEVAWAAGLGRELDMTVGSRLDPVLYGPTLEVRARVLAMSEGDYVCQGAMNHGLPMSVGRCVLLETGGVRFMVISNLMQTYDLAPLRLLGVDPGDFSVVCVKSAHHFRAAFEPGAGRVMLVESGGLARHDIASLEFRHVRRPVWPLDQVGS